MEENIYTVKNTMLMAALVHAYTFHRDDDMYLAQTDPPTDKLFLKGWNTAADGSGTDYAPAAEITAAANIVLYAQWKDTITSVQ